MTEDLKQESKLSDELKSALKSLVDHYENEEESVRRRQLIFWRRLKLYWNSFSNVYLDNIAHDWRVFDYQSNAGDNQNSYYDKNVNVFKAYLESIIAAMSVNIPGVECYPDDAEVIADVLTAKVGNKVGKLLFKHNNATILWLHGLYIWATEGLVCGYHYQKTSKKYGNYKEDKYETVESTKNVIRCVSCKAENPDDITPCPSCNSSDGSELLTEPAYERKLVSTSEKTKSRLCAEVYGGLNVKIPNYAKTQDQVPSLEFDEEWEISLAHAEYGEEVEITPGTYEDYEAWARLSPQYRGEFPKNIVTVRKRWLRPCTYYLIKDEAIRKEIEELYAEGVLVHLVNNAIARCEASDLDDCWTLEYDPLSDYLHKDPAGQVLVNIQDITNDMISLMLQTVEHGVGQTFADPDVVNFDEYRQMEVLPGSLIPAKARTGKSLGDGFFEVATAQFGSEYLPFFQQVQELGQLASGATPSLYGGAQPNSSKTAAQYTMSNANARQRLNTPWKGLSIWWKDWYAKMIPAYIEIVKQQGDEHYVEKTDAGNFINVFIRKTELDGEIGSIELETSEELPTTWAQKREAVINLMSFNNPVIMQAMMAPENLPMLTEALGLDDFVLPGQNDRMVALEEITLLLETSAITIPAEVDESTGLAAIDPATMQPMQDQKVPSIGADAVYANAQVRFETVKNWVTSEAGRLAKEENPEGYENVLLYGMEYYQLVQQQQMQAAMSQDAADSETEKPNKPASKET